jgi:general secretion pathway protein J
MGFTLIELLVACALMAVLALLSWRGLDSIIQTRERLVIASDELRSLTLAFSQMEEDLLKSWPVSLLKLKEPQLRVAVSGERNAQSLHVIREVNRSGFPTRIQRVVYEVRDQQLSRGFSEYGRAETGSGDGGSAVGGGAVQSMVWQPVLGGVRSLTIRGWVDGRGWMEAANLASIEEARARSDAASEAAARGAPGGEGGGAGGAGATRPEPGQTAAQAAAQAAARAAQAAFVVGGLEVVLERQDGQRFLRVFSVKD